MFRASTRRLAAAAAEKPITPANCREKLRDPVVTKCGAMTLASLFPLMVYVR